ncbi:hypothetical protein M408DRAFT_330972 [Serendipita vermifera MAFF 305830]|uniref:Nephrocystin 3-like N-terminal domain-containing protein n=1 Tax=Serendipita vermifera MAFF 305830 TaxID=933852 RepID=A0A0C3AMG4_SERVB|nr:hypothetical protein M408DRAFT_330972 [Serendipita vermifera MAFF 305830]
MTPNALWRIVAYDLARHIPVVRQHLVTALTADDTLPATSNVDELFRQLIHLPLMATEQTQETVAIVVVDALDECGGLDGWKSDHRTGLIRTLKYWSSLPGRFKLVVTSRAEHDIEQLFSTTLHQPLEILAGQKVDSESTEDVRAFLKHELLQIVGRYHSLPSGWPGEETIDKLTEQTAGLFIWIKTFIALLKGGEPQRTLRQLLRRGAGGITSLYAWVLHAHFPNPSDEDVDDFQLVLGAIIFTKSPLDITSLTSLLAMDSSAMEYICNGLYSVLDSTKVVRIHHQSFVDFLVNPEECPEPFCISRQRANQSLAKACFRSMNRSLRFNICDLGSSYIRNRDVPNFDVRVRDCIPSDLAYASCYWADHLVGTGSESETYTEAKYFMNHQFLFWLEILSLLKRVDIGSSMLRSLASWIREFDQDDSLAVDMQRFISAFANVVSQSVPHIYLSALPFAPQGLGVSSTYLSRYPQTLRIRQGGLQSWPAIQHILSGHTKLVESTSFSPDGKRIASGSADCTIRVWDAETGAMIIGPLLGHNDSVKSISFSPDSKHLVSGSRDNSLRVWDVETGEMVMGPLQGHSVCISSVSFSPDGTRIVSSSGDGTVRIWNARTGDEATKPLRGHTGWVKSVSFSPDGRRIVSGSEDYTVRVWDVETGKTVIGPLRKNTNWARSVSFSPDGKRIISCSEEATVRIWDTETDKEMTRPLKERSRLTSPASFSPDGRHIAASSVTDNAIRVWDVQTGEMIMKPLEGHTQWVNSVSFSPDGRRIVSGSDDKTIRVWDAGIGEMVIGPLEGHNGGVQSIASSPDGGRIVSCSYDQTIRIWNAYTGEMVMEPLQGHDLLRSVSFSPDGKRIVSGSSDGEIRIWDAEVGETVIGPLRGHASYVLSVSFSPDGARIVAGSSDSIIRVWDADTGEMVTDRLKGHTDIVSSVSFSPDGKRIVSGSRDNSIRLWNAEDDEKVFGPLQLHAAWVNSVSFSPDGKLIVSGSNDWTIRVWDAETGEAVNGPMIGHSKYVESVAFSPDSRWIVSGSSDNTIRVWDAKMGTTVMGPLKGHTGHVSSVSFLPDGSRIISGSADNTIRIWDIDTGEKVMGLPDRHNDSVEPRLSSGASAQIVSGSRDPSDQLWNTKMGPSATHVFSTFHESSWTEDGWILGSNSELLFWVPPEIRPNLCPTRNTLVLGGNPTHLNLEHFVHGNAWIRCKDRA